MSTRTNLQLRVSEAFFNLPDVSDISTRRFTVTSDTWFGQVFVAKSNELPRIFFLADNTEGLQIDIHKAIVSGSTFTTGPLIASLEHTVEGINPFNQLTDDVQNQTANWYFPNWLATPQLDEVNANYIIVFKTTNTSTIDIYYTLNYRQSVFSQIIGWDGETWSNSNISTQNIGGIQAGAICCGLSGNDLKDNNLDSGQTIVGGRDSARRGYPIFIIMEDLSFQTDNVVVDFSLVPSTGGINGTVEETGQSMMKWYHFNPYALPVSSNFTLTNSEKNKIELNSSKSFVILMQPDRLSPFADSYMPEGDLNIQANTLGIVPIYEGLPVRHGREVIDFNSKRIITQTTSEVLEVSDPFSREPTEYNPESLDDSTNSFGASFWARFLNEKELVLDSDIRDAALSQNPDYIDFSLENPQNEIDVAQIFELRETTIDFLSEKTVTRGFNKGIFYKNKYVFFGKKVTFDFASGLISDTKVPVRIGTEDLSSFEAKTLMFNDSSPTTIESDSQVVGVLDVEVCFINNVETLIFIFQSNHKRTAGVPDLDLPFFEIGYYQGDFSEDQPTVQLLKEEDTSGTLVNFATIPSSSLTDTLEQDAIDSDTLAKLIKPNNIESIFITVANDTDGLGIWEIKFTDDITDPSYVVPLKKPNAVNETGLATTDDKRISFVLNNGNTTYLGTRTPTGRVASVYSTKDFVVFEQLLGGSTTSIDFNRFNLTLNENEVRFMHKVGDILHVWISPVDYDSNGTPIHVGINTVNKTFKILRKFPILDDGDSFYSSLPKISDLEVFPRSKALRHINCGAANGNHIYIQGADKFSKTSDVISSYSTRWVVYDDRIINDAMNFPENQDATNAVYTVTNGDSTFTIEPIRISNMNAFEYLSYDDTSASFQFSPYGSGLDHPLAAAIDGMSDPLYVDHEKAGFFLFEQDDGQLKLVTYFGKGNVEKTIETTYLVNMEISGLPNGANEEFRDDPGDSNDTTDLSDICDGIIRTEWFHTDNNTDGAIYLGLERGSEWEITIDLDNSTPNPDSTTLFQGTGSQRDAPVVRRTNQDKTISNFDTMAGGTSGPIKDIDIIGTKWIFLNGEAGAKNTTGTNTTEIHGVGGSFNIDETKPIVITKTNSVSSNNGVYTGKTISGFTHDESSRLFKDYPEFLPDPSADASGCSGEELVRRSAVYCGVVNYGTSEDDGIEFNNSNIPVDLATSNGIVYLICSNTTDGLKVFKTYGVKQLPSEWGKYYKDALKENEATVSGVALTTTNANIDNFDYVDFDKACFEKVVAGENTYENIIQKTAVIKINGLTFISDFRDDEDGVGQTKVNSSFFERFLLVINNGLKKSQYISSFYKLNYIGDQLSNPSDLDSLSDPSTSQTVLGIKGAETLEKLFTSPALDMDIPLAQDIDNDESRRDILRTTFATDTKSNFFRVESKKLFDNSDRRVEIFLKGMRVYNISSGTPESVTGIKKVAVSGIVDDPESNPENIATGNILLAGNGEIIIDFIKPIYINEVAFSSEFSSPDISGANRTEFQFSIITNTEKRSFGEKIITQSDWLEVGRKYYSDTDGRSQIIRENIASYVQTLRIKITSGVKTLRLKDFEFKTFIASLSTQFSTSGTVLFPENIIVDDISGLLEFNSLSDKLSNFASFESNNSYLEFDLGTEVPITRISMNVSNETDVNTRTIQIDVWDGTTLSEGEPVLENIFTGPAPNYEFSLVRWLARPKEKSRNVEVEFLDSVAPYTPDPLLTDDNIGDLILDFNNISNNSGLLQKSGIAGWSFRPDYQKTSSITVSSSSSRFESGDDSDFIDTDTDGIIVVNAQMDEDGPFATDVDPNAIGMLENSLNVDFALKTIRKIRVTIRNQRNGDSPVKINGLRIFTPLVDTAGAAVTPVSNPEWDIQLRTYISTEK